MTTIEYRTLQSRLTGAIKAIATLRDRAPDLVPLMFGSGLDQAKALPLHTQSSLATLIEELLVAATADGRGRVDRRRILRLVSRLEARS
ncbi:MAG TPA: hypothetical protein VEU08_17255 [Vicinamibacterales bacterium]|nr:hypothetical protein [Vicinamibacterales bacterium]